MSLEEKLFDLRQKAGVSLQTVADAIGVSKAHIWELEKGRSRNPSFDLVRRLAGYYGVTPDVLTGEAVTPAGEDLQVERIHRDLKNLTARDLELIEAMVQKMRQVEPGS